MRQTLWPTSPFALILSGVLALAATPAHAKNPPVAKPWTSQQATAQVQALLPQAQALRGVYRACPFTVKVGDQKDMARMVARGLEQVAGPPLNAQEAVLKGLGLLPAKTDLLKVLQKRLPAQVAGLYDPASRTMLVLRSPPKSLQNIWPMNEQVFRRMVLLHELTHALQDCDEDLMAIGDLSDQAQALSAFYEGEATWVGMKGLFTGPLAQKMDLAALSPDALWQMARRDPSLRGLHPYLQHQLVFPYVFGLGYYATRRKDGASLPKAPGHTGAFLDPPDKAGPPLLTPVPHAAGYVLNFSLGAATLHYWFGQEQAQARRRLLGEGVWALPQGKGKWEWVWWLRAHDEASAKWWQKALQKRLPKGQIAVRREKDLLAVTPWASRHRPPNWPTRWDAPPPAARDYAATRLALLPLAQKRWRLLQADPNVKTLEHVRYPLLVSLAEFPNAPRLTHAPEKDVWRAQIGGLCQGVVGERFEGDAYAATCLAGPGNPPVRLHARLLSFHMGLVMVTCTGKARQWQGGFEDLCAGVLKGATGHPGAAAPLPLAPRP